MRCGTITSGFRGISVPFSTEHIQRLGLSKTADTPLKARWRLYSSVPPSSLSRNFFVPLILIFSYPTISLPTCGASHEKGPICGGYLLATSLETLVVYLYCQEELVRQYPLLTFLAHHRAKELENQSHVSRVWPLIVNLY